jgi:hypothetical protein
MSCAEVPLLFLDARLLLLLLVEFYDRGFVSMFLSCDWQGYRLLQSGYYKTRVKSRHTIYVTPVISSHLGLRNEYQKQKNNVSGEQSAAGAYSHQWISCLNNVELLSTLICCFFNRIRSMMSVSWLIWDKVVKLLVHSETVWTISRWPFSLRAHKD